MCCRPPRRRHGPARAGARSSGAAGAGSNSRRRDADTGAPRQAPGSVGFSQSCGGRAVTAGSRGSRSPLCAGGFPRRSPGDRAFPARLCPAARCPRPRPSRREFRARGMRRPGRAVAGRLPVWQLHLPVPAGSRRGSRAPAVGAGSRGRDAQHRYGIPRTGSGMLGTGMPGTGTGCLARAWDARQRDGRRRYGLPAGGLGMQPRPAQDRAPGTRCAQREGTGQPRGSGPGSAGLRPALPSTAPSETRTAAGAGSAPGAAGARPPCRVGSRGGERVGGLLRANTPGRAAGRSPRGEGRLEAAELGTGRLVSPPQRPRGPAAAAERSGAGQGPAGRHAGRAAPSNGPRAGGRGTPRGADWRPRAWPRDGAVVT